MLTSQTLLKPNSIYNGIYILLVFDLHAIAYNMRKSKSDNYSIITVFQASKKTLLAEAMLSLVLSKILKLTLREKSPQSEFFWSVFSRIRVEYRETRSIFQYSVQMWENTDQKTSEYGHFLGSVKWWNSSRKILIVHYGNEKEIYRSFWTEIRKTGNYSHVINIPLQVS